MELSVDTVAVPLDQSTNHDHLLDSLRQALNHPIPRKGVDFDSLVGALEVALLMKAARECDWNQTRMAQRLNIKRDKVRYRLKVYGIVSPFAGKRARSCVGVSAPAP